MSSSYASVGENDIDSPFRLRNGLVKTIKVCQLGNVSLNSRNVAADCLHGLIELLLASANNEDIGTFVDEKFCSSQPIPSVPPVMAAVLPSSFLGIVFLHCCRAGSLQL